MKHAPHYIREFENEYQSETQMKDAFLGRKFPQLKLQIELAKGMHDYNDNPNFFMTMKREDVRRIEPEHSGLYPFMVVASGDTSDLDAVYYLLKRDPSLACWCKASP